MELTLMTPIGVGKNAKDLILQFVDLFCKPKQPYNEEASAVRNLFAQSRLRRLYLITTRNEDVLRIVTELKADISQEFSNHNIEIHEIPLDIPDVATSFEEERARQIIFERVRELSEGLIIASGGRKNITHALIEAGLLYGCLGYLSITAPRGKEQRDCSSDFQVHWLPIQKILQQRRSYLDITRNELSENFHSTYILPLSLIERLKDDRIGMNACDENAELSWLRTLPKAELHCHLGGEVQPNLLHSIGEAVVKEYKLRVDEALNALCITLGAAKKPRLSNFRDLTTFILSSLQNSGQEHPLHNWSAILHEAGKLCGMKPHDVNACVLSALSEEEIAAIMWQGCEDSMSLNRYMKMGEFGGSNLLQTEIAISMTLTHLLEEAVEENVRYLEVRCSPVNYTMAGLSDQQVMNILFKTAEDFCRHKRLNVNFIIAGTRHRDPNLLEQHVNLAVTFSSQKIGFNNNVKVCGFDLAGDENFRDFLKFRSYLKPLYDNFIQITIHAGEVGDVQCIRDAIYELNARRIGHGLKLIRHSSMMDYVRDADIAIEMCPTSNGQTNAYYNFAYDKFESKNSKDVYPLKRYIEHGITVTINTDNRGISNTSLSQEFLRSAQMTKGGLSKWDVLQLIKNGFKAAFLPLNKRNQLLKEIDREIFELMVKELGEVPKIL